MYEFVHMCSMGSRLWCSLIDFIAEYKSLHITYGLLNLIYVKSFCLYVYSNLYPCFLLLSISLPIFLSSQMGNCFNHSIVVHPATSSDDLLTSITDQSPFIHHIWRRSIKIVPSSVIELNLPPPALQLREPCPVDVPSMVSSTSTQAPVSVRAISGPDATPATSST